MIFFFLRRYNDIDHTVPILDRFLRDGQEPIKVFTLNPFFNSKSDFRLAYLNRQFGTLVYPIHFSSRFLWGAWASLQALFFLIKNRPKALVFDWHRIRRGSTVFHLRKWAKYLRVPVIGIPHGIGLYAKGDFKTTSSSLRFFSDFDHLIVQHQRYKELLLQSQVLEKKISILGSTRFCDDWRNRYVPLVFENYPPVLNIPNRLKIVVMDHSPQFKIFSEAVFQSLQILAASQLCEIIVKPSTGSTGNHKSTQNGISSAELGNHFKVDSETHSLRLIEWSDIVLGTTSSILIEAILEKKIFIYPRHWHGNDMLWDELNACQAVDSDTQLMELVKNCAQLLTKNALATLLPNTNPFIETVIYGGDPTRDVIGQTCTTIKSIAQTPL